MKNSIKTTLSVLLLGLASTAALANPTTPVAATDVQSVQLTAQQSKAIINTRGAELTGIYEVITSDDAPVLTTTTPIAPSVAYEVVAPNKAIISTKGALVSGRYEDELNRATTVKAMETKAVNQAQPQAEADSSNEKSLRN